MKKIGISLQACCGKKSGIGEYTYEISRHLSDAAENYILEGRLFNYRSRCDIKEAAPEISFPVKEYKKIPTGLYKLLWKFSPLTYDDFFGKADISLFFNYIIPPKISGKTITVIHDAAYFRYPEEMSYRTKAYLKRNLKDTVKRADHIVTVSEFSKSELMHFLGISEDKISVVPCAPACSQKTDDSILEEFCLTGPYILYVGTIEPRKNIFRLVKAFDLLKREFNIDHKLVLTGGKGWNDRDILKAIGESEYKNDIIMTGYVTEERKNALYQHAKLFVFPSLYEGFGMPPLEAMLNGCPVVAGNIASLPEACGDAAEYVDPYNIESIANGIKNVIMDEKRAGELIEKGKEQVGKYSWDKSARAFMNVIEKVLS